MHYRVSGLPQPDLLVLPLFTMFDTDNDAVESAERGLTLADIMSAITASQVASENQQVRLSQKITGCMDEILSLVGSDIEKVRDDLRLESAEKVRVLREDCDVQFQSVNGEVDAIKALSVATSAQCKILRNDLANGLDKV